MPEQWDRVKEILASALEQSVDQRSSFVRQACGHDDALRAEVESLLSSSAAADSVFEYPPASDVFSASPNSMLGRHIDAYRILRETGHGGMAVVYLAERADEEFRKRVAIKMVKAGANSEEILARFRNERQTLAALDHPNIVKLLDGGSTEEGLPYLVMEYVEGVPIDEYCDTHRLSITDRLRLFQTVCSVVQYAHQNLVIHRDLKPSNILITTEGVPRLLDFGIAKLLNPECFLAPLVTRSDWRPMTPEYASPEQVRGEPVTIATDIYSLGVLLYELLTGHLPHELAHGSWAEIERLVCEQEPPRPSTKVRTDRENSAAIANMRRAEPKQLVTLLHGDLDWITMKALEKDRTRRYATASEVAADVGRYLGHKPVIAGPASAIYRTRKYVQRHPFGMAVAAGVLILSATFVILQTIQLHRTTRERDRANRVTEFMTEMFKVSDPNESRGNSVTAREILDKASKDIDPGLAKDPQLQAQMMHVMGNVYRELGLYPRAQSLLERAVAISRRVHGPENPETLSSMDDLAWTLNQEAHLPEAEKLQRETLEIKKRVLGTGNQDTAGTMALLAWTLDREGQYAEAEKLERHALEMRRRDLGHEDEKTLRVMSNLAATLGHEGHYAEAEKLKRETLEIRQRTLGPDHPYTLTSMNNLAFTLQQEGHYTEAEKLQRQTLDLQQRVLGPEHPDTLRSKSNLAADLAFEGRFAQAEKLQRETLEIKKSVLGPDHQDTLWAMQELASSLHAEGHFAEAAQLQRETLDIQRRVLGRDNPNAIKTMDDLALTLRDEGHYAEAEKLEREELNIERRIGGPEDRNTLWTMGALARTLNLEGHSAEAEKLERETLEIQRRVLGLGDRYVAVSTYDLACILVHRGRPDEALSLLREAIDHGLDPASALGMEKDPDLKSLHGDPRFAALVSYVHQQALATQKPK